MYCHINAFYNAIKYLLKNKNKESISNIAQHYFEAIKYFGRPL